MNNSIEIKRHSTAHLLATAVKILYPKAKFGIGPVIENGFYYDIDFPEAISEKDLEKIEEKIKELIKSNISFKEETMDIVEAIKYFKELDEDYKQILLNDLKEKGTTGVEEENQNTGESVEQVSIYKTGDFVDLCRGPHISSAKEIDPEGLKLFKLAGAYWRGDEKNKMLTRIYGLLFETKKELDDYLNLLEEAEK